MRVKRKSLKFPEWFVFSNQYPDRTKFSEDRWDVVNFDEQGRWVDIDTQGNPVEPTDHSQWTTMTRQGGETTRLEIEMRMEMAYDA